MTIALPKGFKEHYGVNVEQMPVILGDRKASPMNVAQFMKARLLYGDRFPALLDNYSDSSDLVAYSDAKDEKVKFVFTTDAQGNITRNGRTALKLINPKAERINGAVILGKKYDALQGIEVPASELGILETRLTRAQILESKVWRMLARNPNEVPKEIAEDAQLLPEYVDFIASKREAREWSPFPIMGVYMDSFDVAKLRAFYVGGLDDGSVVSGRGGLGSGSGRLVGLAPEAQKVLAGWKPSQKKYEVLPYTLSDLTRAEAQLEGLAKILQAGQVDKINSFLTKARKSYQ